MHGYSELAKFPKIDTTNGAKADLKGHYVWKLFSIRRMSRALFLFTTIVVSEKNGTAFSRWNIAKRPELNIIVYLTGLCAFKIVFNKKY
ncbi:hypothetical protein BCV53_05145 [Parageobacillus thermoglucosidasius]|uniref:Uncharacterized protein n=1 Tax=Parageobacillus thermoglucosidasius TaxID=1426 RepID=A0AAN0YN43_PARTM|nr:hypothetical protein AOT13_05135 [Parageobacillus thermoglucosidasius]ANZ29529.1 hypothetical protein BCV53_05145 [Parageobacillus thermoglucosidasius]APM80267.1 hypothetical protein BCV54_05150 [Parageobacillus thermoglucosidasius]KJX70192.1 hypothetical protein WH82_03195 [Parageobacillus thermoglucosidasius]OUM92264.1 MAG: hypothetical protein BAA00_17600 [Parageobacillus thermoglucosidasius]